MRAFRRLAALGCVILATLIAAAEADAETLAREDLADLIGFATPCFQGDIHDSLLPVFSPSVVRLRYVRFYRRAIKNTSMKLMTKIYLKANKYFDIFD